MSSLEDDVELQDAVQEQPAAPKRRLSRLKRASNVSSVTAVADERAGAQLEVTTAQAAAHRNGHDVQAEAPGGTAVGAEHSKGDSVHSASGVEDSGSNQEDDAAAEDVNGAAAEEDDEDYWDEEDELAIDFQRELAGGGKDNTPAPSGTVGGDEDEDGEGGSAPSSPAQLNAQTQRMLRDSAVRDRIGKGHSVEIAPLSGILAKLKAQRQAVIARTKSAPVRRRMPTPEPAAAAADEGEDDDILLLSDEEEQPTAPAAASGPDLGAGTQPPSVNPAPARPGLAHDQESQEELLLNLGTGSEDGRSRAAFSQPSLHLTLDSQTQHAPGDYAAAPPAAAHAALAAALPAQAAADAEQRQPAEPKALSAPVQPVAGGTPAAAAPAAVAAARPAEDHAAMACPTQSEEQPSGSGEDEEIADASVGGSDDEDSQDGAGAISGSSSSSDSSDSDDEDEEDHSPQVTSSPAADEPTAGASDAARRQAAVAAAKAQLRDQPGDLFKSNFFEMEAEMSDDEGHSDDGDDDDANADGMLAELIGEAREKKKDAARREKLHAKWLQAQDASDMEAVVAAMKSGWRRPGRDGSLDGDLGTDRDARRRRAALMGISEEELDAADFDIAQLFPGARRAADGGGSGDEDEAAEEAAAARDAAAQRLLDASQELEPEAIMGGCSQETLGLLSRGPASRPPAQPALQRSRLGLFGSELTNMTAGGASFLGRSAPGGSKVVRGGSGEHTNGGGRSFVFGGRDDSNSGMPPAEQPGEVAEDAGPRGPTSFAGLRSMAASAAAAVARKPKRKAAAPALLGMLSGSKGSGAAAGVSAAGDGAGSARAGASLISLLGAGAGPKRRKGDSSRALDSLFRKLPVP